jgi:hypothetical protein
MSNLSLKAISDPVGRGAPVGGGGSSAGRAPSPSGSDSRLEIEGTRARQTERPPVPFRSVLAGGVSLLMSGAEVATHVVGGPVLAAAVHDARVGATGAIAGSAPAGLAGRSPHPSAMAATAAGATAHPESTVEGMLHQGELSNLQLLTLQQEVQQQNQRFTTVSNVMRAKHDTAKAAVSNIRA